MRGAVAAERRDRRADEPPPVRPDADAAAPLRVLLALESSGPGGAERTLLHLGRGLRDTGVEVQLASMRPGWLTQCAAEAGLPVWVLPQAPGLDPAWVVRLSQRLRKARIDLVHSHEFAMNVYGGAAARLAGIPSLATIHGRHWVADRRARRMAYRLLVRLGMRVVAVSDDLAGYLARGLALPRDAIEVVENGIPLPSDRELAEAGPARAAVREELRVAEDEPLLLAVGNLYAVKDHATLLRAVARLPSGVVAIAGRGEEEARLRKLASALGLTDRVRLLGARDDVDRLLLAADLLVHSSRSEGLPLAVLEAMAAGRAVVATAVGGVPDAVLDGRTGLLVPAGEPDALGAAMARLLEDPERREAMGRAGRARVAESFSVERMTARYHGIYAGLLESASS